MYGRTAAKQPIPVLVDDKGRIVGLFAGALPDGTDRSGSVTAGGVAQTLAPANSARNGLDLMNISNADLWINEIGGSATPNVAGSWRIQSGQGFSVATNRAVSIVGATTGQSWTATEY